MKDDFLWEHLKFWLADCSYILCIDEGEKLLCMTF